MALKCVEACRMKGVEFLNMWLIRFNPAVPKKTTNCVGSALNFTVRPGNIPEFLDTNNDKRRIGALGEEVWGNRGNEAAGLYGEYL
jgi:hypothetical protein